MANLAEAQEILKVLGLPAAQQGEAAGYTLLALSGVGPDSSWKSAAPKTLRTVDIIDRIAEKYAKRYAPNSRETIRRQVLHQFEQAGLVERNPDDALRPTNSGNTCYCLTSEATKVVAAFGSRAFKARVAEFLANQPALIDRYRGHRELQKVVVKLPDGASTLLSAGKHNELQAAIIHEFWPRFIPEAQLLYLGDTAKKKHWVKAEALEAIGFPFSVHDKFPDLVFDWPENGWLILVEAVTSHGPFSPKRRQELEQMVQGCERTCIYLTAFPSWREFKLHLEQIAWDTEVWLAEIPDHMIHYNGPKFLGTHGPS